MTVAIYARVSTADQNPENQLLELRRFSDARHWTVFKEYVDHGVSGSKQSRPALDELMRHAKRRHFDCVLVWRLDRFGRNLKALIFAMDELTALGISFVSLNEGIDATTPAGKLQMHLLGAIASYEVARVGERVRSGLARARAQGVRLGRPRPNVSDARIAELSDLSVRAAASKLGVSKSFIHNWRLSRKVAAPEPVFAP